MSSTEIPCFPDGKRRRWREEHSKFQKERVCGWMGKTDGLVDWRLLDDPSSDESNEGNGDGRGGRERRVKVL